MTPLRPDELAELRAVQLSLQHLRDKPFDQVVKDPLILGCLRNVVEARRRALAERRARSIPEAADFQLTP